ncbi:MAG: bifunctional DNA primase/polymerase [Hyphomonadaceae bacterium]|nr:bifunctional DNA primase/polymerase [Hyphomonadaceae bacterium]
MGASEARPAKAANGCTPPPLRFLTLSPLNGARSYAGGAHEPDRNRAERVRFAQTAAKKCPALKGWRARASRNTAHIAALFEEAQHADAIGIAAGEAMFVIDLDRDHGDGAMRWRAGRWGRLVFAVWPGTAIAPKAGPARIPAGRTKYCGLT